MMAWSQMGRFGATHKVAGIYGLFDQRFNLVRHSYHRAILHHSSQLVFDRFQVTVRRVADILVCLAATLQHVKS
jgi:hypothetical protein